MHSLGFYHRDLKPDNIVLVEDELISPIVIDFGCGIKDAKDSTTSSSYIGTTTWMSGEVLKIKESNERYNIKQAEQYTLVFFLLSSYLIISCFIFVFLGIDS